MDMLRACDHVDKQYIQDDVGYLGICQAGNKDNQLILGQTLQGKMRHPGNTTTLEMSPGDNVPIS